MNESQIKKLDNLIDKNIKYKEKYYLIKKYKTVNSLLMVITNSTTFNFLPTEIDPFLDELIFHEVADITPINWEPTIKENTLPVKSNNTKVDLAVFEPTESQKAIQNSLIEMLEKVKDDPKNIPQAKAVVDIANAMVNMEKTQIQFINTVNKLGRR